MGGDSPLQRLLGRLSGSSSSRQGDGASLAPASSSHPLALATPLSARSCAAWQRSIGPVGQPAGTLAGLWQPAGSDAAQPIGGAPLADAGATSSSSSADVRLECPCALRPAVSPKGLDLQLRLFQLTVGAPWEQPAHRSGSGSGSSGSSSVASTEGGAVLRRRALPPRQQQPLPPLVGVLDRAAGLLAARLLHPDAVAPLVRLLAAAHCAQAAVRLSALALYPTARSSARRRLRAGIGRPVADGAARLGGALQRHGEPAFWLLAAAVLWAHLDPSSLAVGECIGTLLPVLAAYNSTARTCIRQGLSGGTAEELWRRTHKWAARRSAGLLEELPATPPLAGAVAAYEALSICIAAVVGGAHFGSIGGDSSALQLWASVGVRSKEQLQERRSTLAPAAGHVAATPAGPVEDEPLSSPSSSGSAASSVSDGIEQALAGMSDPTAQQQQQQKQQQADKPAAARRWATLRDSPSEMPCSPVGQDEQLQRPATQCSGSGGSSVLGDAVEAALLQQAAAGGDDFMHPSHWAAVRRPPHGAAPGHAHSSSSSSVAGSSGTGSMHSFLLDGARWSSSEDGSEDGEGGTTTPAGAWPAAAEAAAAAPEADGAASAAEAAAEAPLPLYGRGDHLADSTRLLTLAERLQLAVRAVQLFILFAPFLLLGTTMLLLAARVDERRHAAAEPSPAARRLRVAAWRLLLGACRRAGAAAIKWGQWSSTRSDIFPPEFCETLSELHDRAPVHSFAESRRAVEAAFGRPLGELFLSFDHKALASGSIAQVHRATLAVDGRPLQVAVKVRHPGVAQAIWRDFQLLRPLAALTARVQSLRSLNLSDSVAQFSNTMTAQADLRVEAAHLERFYDNFRAASSSVHVPRPLPGLCTEAVLVETFEEGRSVQAFIRSPHPHNTQIVSLGTDAFLKMLLQDNFVHTDLHPGNILVRSVPAAGHAAAGHAAEQHAAEQHAAEQHAAPHGGSHSGSGSGSGGERVQLVLLDFGLAEELTPAVRRHFVSFLHYVARGDGERAAQHLLRWSVNQRCPDPAAFTADLCSMFERECDVHSEAGINLDAVMKGTLALARRHEVSIDSNYAALCVGVCVIVGFAQALDPVVNIMDAAAPCFLYHALTGRVSGRLYL